MRGQHGCIRARIGLTDRADQDEGPLRIPSSEGFEQRQVELVGINGADEDQTRAIDRRQITGPRKSSRTGLSEMAGIGDIAEQMRAGIQGRQGLLQLRRCRENSIDSPAEILFGRFELGDRHPRLCLDAIHTVINRGMKATKLQVKTCIGIERPQQRGAQIKATIRPEQGKVETPAIKSTLKTAHLPWHHQGRKHPDPLTYLSQRGQASAQSAHDPICV